SLALAGLYQLTRNWWWAVWGVDALALIGLFWSSWGIWGLWSRGKSSKAQVWLGLFLAWSPAPFHYLTGSGLLALSFLSIALWAWMKGVNNASRQRWQWWGISLLVSWLMVGLRTAYLPLVVMIPLGMALVVYHQTKVPKSNQSVAFTSTAGWPRSPRCWGGMRRCMGLRRFFAYFFAAKKVGPAECVVIPKQQKNQRNSRNAQCHALDNCQEKQPKQWLTVGGSFLLSFLLFGLLQWGRRGQESLTDLIDGTWHWSNLWEMEPFLFKSFFYYGKPHELLLQQFSFLAYWGLQIVAYSSTVIGLVIWGKSAVNSRLGLPFRAWGQLGLLVMGITLAMLGWLSIRIPPESWNEGGLWTFVMEPRYFAPIMWMWLLFAFGLMAQLPKNWEQKGLAAFLIAVSLLACTYPVFLRWRMYGQGDRTDSWLQDPRKTLFFEGNALSLPETPFVWTSYDNSHLGNLLGGEVLAWEEWEHMEELPSALSEKLIILLPHSELLHIEARTDTLWQKEGFVLLKLGRIGGTSNVPRKSISQ
ncbi:MAG: hypothetical protein AAF399_06615, partial [Bacteroidota bacterium]